MPEFSRRLRIAPGRNPRLDDALAHSTPGSPGRAAAERRVERNLERLFLLQNRMYAENRRSLLIVLQGMDGAGKDGVIRHVARGLNPQGCTVTPFKAPSAEELDHDFLWRFHRVVPARGDIAIFNRSHYEDVGVVRVNQLVPKAVWSKRYEAINAFEKGLAESGVVILKFFLHISRDEQKQRLKERLEDPEKSWKFNPSDLEARAKWDEYMEAYKDAIRKCNAEWAPWFVIPADRKWYRNLVVSEIVADALEKLKPAVPKPALDLSKIRIR
jgi:PPK2 family polyphosphate:nucleotide phosphotransferase